MRVLILASLYGLSCAFTSQPRRASFSRATTTALEASSSSLVVISPPGGVGEVAAVKAASMGASVRWFVVGSGQEAAEQKQVILAPHALQEIAQAGGEVQLAGADAPDLLSNTNSAIPAVSTWCGAADALVCVFDASLGSGKMSVGSGGFGEAVITESMWKDAVKVAAREAARQISGKKIAVLAAGDNASQDDQEEGGKIGGLVGGLLGGGRDKVQIPETLASAMANDPKQIISLRHGQLFGIPESSPDFSALVGGPLKDPELCEEYYTRSIRVDPTVSVSGNIMMGETTRSSRHAVGEAAALLALEKVTANGGLDVCLTSLRGNDPVSIEEWQKELDRVAAMSVASVSGDAVPLFATEFSSVPDVKRLTDWLATKWAPAVLRTYEIAAIRVGGRPVYAAKVDDTTVEITWQELVKFESINTGKMVLQVSDTGLVAARGPGDASKGYGKVSRAPLAGEDVLVRRLAEAASQAIEKGLAKKVRKALHAYLIERKEESSCGFADIHSNLTLQQCLFCIMIGSTRQGGSTTQEKGCPCSSSGVYHSSFGRCCTQCSDGWTSTSGRTSIARTCPWYSQKQQY